MKILSGVVVTLGILVLVAGVGIMAWGTWIAYWHYATLSTGRSAEFSNPLTQLIGAGALLAFGGFFAGLGLGMPKGKKPVDTPPAAPASSAPANPA